MATHKDLIFQAADIINSYVKCYVDYKNDKNVTIYIDDRKTEFDDEKRAGDFVLGFANGIVTGMDIMVKKNKKFATEILQNPLFK